MLLLKLTQAMLDRPAEDWHDSVELVAANGERWPLINTTVRWEAAHGAVGVIIDSHAYIPLTGIDMTRIRRRVEDRIRKDSEAIKLAAEAVGIEWWRP